MTNLTQDYLSLISDLVKKHMVMLGPNVAISQARKVASLVVDDDGHITSINGDSQEALDSLVLRYTNLSGQLAQNSLSNLLQKYPQIQKENG